MPVIQSKENWKLETQEARMKKGKLVRVEIRPGQFVKRYEADLQNKAASYPKSDKLSKDPLENKSTIEPGSDDPVVFDEFESISGIGKASARSLNENGVYTFAQLAVAGNLPYLSDGVNAKIETWRSNWDPNSSD